MNATLISRSIAHAATLSALSVDRLPISRFSTGSLRGRINSVVSECKDPLAPCGAFQIEYEVNVVGRDQADVGRLLLYEAVQAGDGVFTILAHAGIRRDAFVADITLFYPNGRFIDEDDSKLVRRGAGKALLEIMLRTCRMHGAEAIFTLSESTSFANFLTKRHNFRPILPSNTTFLRLL